MDAEVIDQPEVVEGPSLRETIEDAVDAVEGKPDGESTPPAARPAETPASGTPAEGPKPEGVQPAVPAGPAAKAADQHVVPTAAPELKAPSQWRPAVREKWNALPREVQEEIVRREGDSLRLIGSVGQKIRLADEVGQHIAPFMEKIQANGATPSAFLGDVFTTIKHLAGGSPQDKAEVVANIIQSYGIDLRALDGVLSGRISAPPPNPQVLEAQRRAYAAESVLARQRDQQEQVAERGAAETLQQFSSDPKNEFFGDVRELMADLIESGRANSMEDAYSAAIWANPDTRKILLQREAEARVAAKRDRAGAARRASSSVTGAPRGPGGSPGIGNMSLRDTIAAAMDAQEGV